MKKIIIILLLTFLFLGADQTVTKFTANQVNTTQLKAEVNGSGDISETLLYINFSSVTNYDFIFADGSITTTESNDLETLLTNHIFSNTLVRFTNYHTAMEFGNSTGDYRGESIAGTGDVNFTFIIPLDAVILIDVSLIIIPADAAAMPSLDIDLNSDYGKIGELANTHSETDTTSTYDYSGLTNRKGRLSLMSVLSVAEAGDVCGVNVDHNAIGGTVFMLGYEFIYEK